MKIILSSNPYRDRGLRAALEAKRILEQAGAQTVMCLPFMPKRGERADLPRQVALAPLEKELPGAMFTIKAKPSVAIFTDTGKNFLSLR